MRRQLRRYKVPGSYVLYSRRCSGNNIFLPRWLPGLFMFRSLPIVVAATERAAPHVVFDSMPMEHSLLVAGAL